jgi:hypothetical protein
MDPKRSVGKDQTIMLQVHLVGGSREKMHCFGILEKTNTTKGQRGWELKNVFLFSKAFTAKNIWRLIQGCKLRAQVIRDKYIALNSVEVWVRNHVKRIQNASIVWKVVNTSFPLVGNWLV